jgi:hypothetical protein
MRLLGRRLLLAVTEPGLNSILAANDAFFASHSTRQSSGHPDAKQAAKIGVEVNRAGNPSKFAPWAPWRIQERNRGPTGRRSRLDQATMPEISKKLQGSL